MSTPKKSSKSSAKKAPSAKTAASRPRKKIVKTAEPLMAYESVANVKTSVTSTRRNVAGVIERTDKYKNIADGLVPFRFATEYAGSGNSLDVRDAVILCQNAYYNFSQFRNVIDLMTEFSLGDI